MDEHMTTTLVNDTLFMAIKTRNPNRGLIWHTDRGNCYDNAVAESFFHSLKTELTHHIKFETRSQANQVIFEYIEVFYNRQRLHSYNNYMSPMEFEEKMLLNEIAA